MTDCPLRVSGCVGQQVAGHLGYARSVCHDGGEFCRQIHLDVVAAPSADKRGSGLIHQSWNVGRLGAYRKRAGLNMSRIQQVGYHPAHPVGLVVDNRVELASLRGVQV